MGWIGKLFGAAISGVSALDAGGKRKDAENELENMQTPIYRRNQGILDFYDNALRKYNVQPTETTEYKLAKQNIGQGVVQGLNAAQDRRSGLAAIPSLISGQNNALLKAAINAENQKQRQAGTVLQAGNQATAEKMREYRFNEMGPFEKKYNLLAMKAAGLSRKETAGMQGLYNSLGSMGDMGGFGGGGGGFGG